MQSAAAAAGRVAALRAHLGAAPTSEQQTTHESAPCSSMADDADDETLLAQLGASRAPPPPAVDVAVLQHVLEHDNWRTREGLKELMKDPIFVP
jgi:hypothetical protein